MGKEYKFLVPMCADEIAEIKWESSYVSTSGKMIVLNRYQRAVMQHIVENTPSITLVRILNLNFNENKIYKGGIFTIQNMKIETTNTISIVKKDTFRHIIEFSSDYIHEAELNPNEINILNNKRNFDTIFKYNDSKRQDMYDFLEERCGKMGHHVINNKCILCGKLIT